jgi:hypothetical protein
MTVITADAAMQAFLASVTEEAEIRDAQGRLLGIYTPQAQARDYHAKAAHLFDLAEAERTLAEGTQGSSLAEVWERIRALENQG